MIDVKVKYTGRIKFPFRVKDIRTYKIPFGRGWKCEESVGWTLVLFPKVGSYVQRIAVSDDDITATYSWGIYIRFLWWSLEVCNGWYRKNFRMPWIEDGKHKFEEIVRDYEQSRDAKQQPV